MAFPSSFAGAAGAEELGPQALEPESALSVGVRAAAVEVFEGAAMQEEEGARQPDEESRVHRMVGVVVSAEKVLLPGWLNAEVSWLVVPGAEGFSAVDLFLNEPFELGRSVEATVGVGLASEWPNGADRPPVPGVGCLLGTRLFPERPVGLALSWEYELFFGSELEHELVLSGGVAMRM